MKTHIYTRISTPYQNLTNQRKRIDDEIKNQNLDCIYYEDVGSGTIFENRPGLKRLLDNLSEGDIVIVTELSRLIRTIENGMILREILIEKKILLICLDMTENLLEKENLEIFIQILRNSEREINTISKRISIGMKFGKNTRSPPPFGWKFVGRGIAYKEVPEQQKILKKIFELQNANNQNLSYEKIARILNENGDNLTLALNKLNPKQEYKFHGTTIKRILTTDYVSRLKHKDDLSVNKLSI